MMDPYGNNTIDQQRIPLPQRAALGHDPTTAKLYELLKAWKERDDKDREAKARAPAPTPAATPAPVAAAPTPAPSDGNMDTAGDVAFIPGMHPTEGVNEDFPIAESESLLPQTGGWGFHDAARPVESTPPQSQTTSHEPTAPTPTINDSTGVPPISTQLDGDSPDPNNSDPRFDPPTTATIVHGGQDVDPVIHTGAYAGEGTRVPPPDMSHQEVGAPPVVRGQEYPPPAFRGPQTANPPKKPSGFVPHVLGTQQGVGGLASALFTPGQPTAAKRKRSEVDNAKPARTVVRSNYDINNPPPVRAGDTSHEGMEADGPPAAVTETAPMVPQREEPVEHKQNREFGDFQVPDVPDKPTLGKHPRSVEIKTPGLFKDRLRAWEKQKGPRTDDHPGLPRPNQMEEEDPAPTTTDDPLRDIFNRRPDWERIWGSA